MSAPADESTTIPVLFAKPDKSAYLLLIGACLLNLLPQITFFGSIFAFRFDPVFVALFIVILIGYQYGKKFGLIAGSIAFFPNLILHLLGYVALLPTFRGNEFAGRVELSPYITSRTLLIGYFLHAALGYVSACMREKIARLKDDKEYIFTTKDASSKNIAPLIILAFFLTLDLRLGMLTRISPSELYYLLPLYASFYYGLQRALCIVIFIFLLSQISFDIAVISFRYPISDWDALVFLVSLYMAGNFRVYKADVRQGVSKAGFFVCFVFTCVLSNLNLTLSRDVYFNLAGCALGLVVVAGFIYGPRSGFMFGMLWGVLNIHPVAISASMFGMVKVMWPGIWSVLTVLPAATKVVGFSAPSIYLIGAPILGYLSGVEIPDSKNFLQRGLSFILMFYAVVLLAYSMFGAIAQAPSVIMNALESSMVLIMLHYTCLRYVSRFTTPALRRERSRIDASVAGAPGAIRALPVSRRGALVVTALYWLWSGVLGHSVWAASEEALSVAIVGAISGMVFGITVVVLSTLMGYAPRWQKAMLFPLGLGVVCAISWYIAGMYYPDQDEVPSLVGAFGSAICSGVIVCGLIPGRERWNHTAVSASERASRAGPSAEDA